MLNIIKNVCFFGCAFLLFGCNKNETKKIQEERLYFENIFSDEEKRVSPETISKIDKYYKKIWEDGNLWGGFLIAKGDRIIYEKYRGFSDETHTHHIDKETPLHIASISKPITALATLKLIEKGKISLKTPIKNIFKGFPYEGVTIENLLNQRSGLPKYEYFMPEIAKQDPSFQKNFWSNQDILQAMIIHKPDIITTPETKFIYCNTNYALLALIIEKTTQQPFPIAMKNLVFEPLEMKNTFVFQKKHIGIAAKSFYLKGEKAFSYDYFDLVYGDKNIYTTPRDLLNFSIALYSNRFLKPNLQKLFFTPYSNEKIGIKNYGLGFRLKTYDSHEVLPYHTGWWHGSNSVFGHLLKEKVTIVSIGNKYSKSIYSALALSALFGEYPSEIEKLHNIMNKEYDTPTEDLN